MISYKSRKGNYLLIIFIIHITILSSNIFCQNSVSIGTEDINEDAVLQLVSPDNDQGFLVPRMNTTQREAMSPQNDDNGLLVYDYEQSSFYYWHDGAWHSLSNSTAFSITGTGAATVQGTFPNFIIHSNPNDTSALNEIQDLILIGDTLFITRNYEATAIDLSPYLDDTDEQDLFFNTENDSLFINNGNGVDLSYLIEDNDSDTINEIQNLSLTGHILRITRNSNTTEIDLSVYLDNTDSQNLIYDQDFDSLSIDNGNSIYLGDLIEDDDADTTNEIITYGELIDNELQIAEGEDTIKIDISSYGWQLTGNDGTNNAVNFIGTTDNEALNIRTNNQDRIQISNTGSVGIGTSPASLCKLYVENTNGHGIFCRSESGFGIYSINQDSSTYAVFGRGRYGVKGEGIASDYAYGLWGETYSGEDNSKGVYGDARASSGITYGVYGQTRSETEYSAGVYGFAEGTTDFITRYGVHGTANGNSGVGVKGEGRTGVKGESNALGGIGVEGVSQQRTGVGVRGEINNDERGIKYGVYGRAIGADELGETTYGVFGEARGGRSIGVYGIGTRYGVYGNSTGENSAAIYGSADESSSYAGFFRGKVITTGDYTYVLPRTRILSIPASAFISATTTMNSVYNFGAYVYLRSEISVAPINLPHGAIILDVVLYYLDRDVDAGDDISFTLRRSGAIPGQPEPVIDDICSNTSSGSNNNIRSMEGINWDPSTTVWTVNNEIFQYYLYINNPPNSPDSFRIYRARIFYTVTRAD